MEFYRWFSNSLVTWADCFRRIRFKRCSITLASLFSADMGIIKSFDCSKFNPSSVNNAKLCIIGPSGYTVDNGSMKFFLSFGDPPISI